MNRSWNTAKLIPPSDGTSQRPWRAYKAINFKSSAAAQEKTQLNANRKWGQCVYNVESWEELFIWYVGWMCTTQPRGLSLVLFLYLGSVGNKRVDANPSGSLDFSMLITIPHMAMHGHAHTGGPWSHREKCFFLYFFCVTTMIKWRGWCKAKGKKGGQQMEHRTNLLISDFCLCPTPVSLF